MFLFQYCLFDIRCWKLNLVTVPAKSALIQLPLPSEFVAQVLSVVPSKAFIHLKSVESLLEEEQELTFKRVDDATLHFALECD